MHIMKEKKPPKIHKPRQARLLQEEDIAIWGQATADVTPFSAPNIMTDDRAKGLKRGYKDKIGQNMTGTITLETFNGPAVQTHHSSSFQIDAALKKRFAKGELPMDGQIDLHGLTLPQAHQRFMRFITARIKEGARFIVVITGKGSAEGSGVIRQNFPLWCEDQQLKPHILQVTRAQPKHGGTGASYILLRRQK